MMEPGDWKLLKMLPPSENHDPFHEYVKLDGRFTDEGVAIHRFVLEMLHEAKRRREARR